MSVVPGSPGTIDADSCSCQPSWPARIGCVKVPNRVGGVFCAGSRVGRNERANRWADLTRWTSSGWVHASQRRKAHKPARIAGTFPGFAPALAAVECRPFAAAVQLMEPSLREGLVLRIDAKVCHAEVDGQRHL